MRKRPIAYFARAGHGSRDAIQERTPELRPLADKAIAIFGLGCLGAPSALEFARAGVGELRILDHDFVDPATTSRWPFGLSAAGLYKAEVIRNVIQHDYPSTQVVGHVCRIGGVRLPDSDIPTDPQVLQEMTEGADLIYDATAELGMHHMLSEYAAQAAIPYLGVVGTQGGWGGKVFRIVPQHTPGCWFCYRLACDDESIPEPPSDPGGEVQPAGCADPTFTGAGFDMVQVALHGVRTAVSTLCSEAGGYPSMDWDVTHIKLRSEEGRLIAPVYETYSIEKHPDCRRCNH